MGKTKDLGHLAHIVAYNAENHITVPAGITMHTNQLVASQAWVTTALGSYALSSSLSSYVPTSRTITINGTTFDLSANRNWDITSMIYPAAGIALSTGSAWGTSITNNSANWNTAFGWGNHASAGYLTGITSAQVTTALGFTPVTNARTITINGTTFDLSADRTYTISTGTTLNGTGFVKASGTTITYDNSTYLTGITSALVTGALGFTPYNATNPAGYITGITSANVTTALGFTPYNATNPAGYITGISFANVSAKPTTLSGYGITDALGYVSFTDSIGLNDNKLYLRTKGDDNHYIWNAADDWEEIVAYSGTGLRIKSSNGTTLATFATGGNSMNITGNAATTSQREFSYLRVNGNDDLYLDYNYGCSIVGVYSASRYQGVFSMGNAYKLARDGSSTGNLYGMAWSHPNAGGVAGNLNTHGLLVMENGTFLAAVSGSIRARDDMRAPIFYDSNDTGYYLDPNNTGVALRIAGAIRGDHVGWTGEHNKIQWHSNHMYFQNMADGYWIFRRSNGSEPFLLHADGWGQASGSWRAPIFYDSNDTAYYLDPNSESNLYRFTSATMTRNAMNYLSINSPFTTRAAQAGPYQNGTMGWGTTDFNTVFSNWGSGFIDTWSNPGNAPGGSSHYVGIQSCHYNHQNSANVYGFQMACAGEADNRFFWRSAWPSMRGWVEMIHTGNIGSQTVSTAGNLSVNATANNIYNYGWFRNYGDSGLYNQDYGCHIARNSQSSHGSWSMWGYTKAGYVGMNLQDPQGYNNNLMFEQGRGGVYQENGGGWHFYYDRPNDCLGLSGSETYDWVRACTNGKHRITNDTWCDATSWAYTFSNISDGRLKENIITVDSALDKVLQLRGVYYNWIIDTENKKHIGLIAQETAAVCPEVVNYHDETDTYSVNYSELSGLFVESTKELNQKLMDANARIELLEAKLNELLNA